MAHRLLGSGALVNPRVRPRGGDQLSLADRAGPPAGRDRRGDRLPTRSGITFPR